MMMKMKLPIFPCTEKLASLVYRTNDELKPTKHSNNRKTFSNVASL